jgi:hypothetical protein
MLCFQSPPSTIRVPGERTTHGSQRGPCGERCPSPELSLTHKSPGKRAPFQAPQQGPRREREMSVPWAFFHVSFLISSKGAPLTGFPNIAAEERDATFLEPSFNYFSKFPVNGPPRQVPQWGPYGEGHLFPEPSSTHPDNSHFPQKSLVKEPPPCSPTGSIWREMLHLWIQWSIHSFISVRVSSEGALPQNGGKYMVRAPCGWKAYL